MGRMGDFYLGCMEDAHVPEDLMDAALEAAAEVDHDGLTFSETRAAIISAMRQAVDRAEVVMC
jgi:hypothetical protein